MNFLSLLFRSKAGVLATIIAAAISTPLFADSPPGTPDGWSDGYVYSNGARIHYYQAKPAPDKPVIIMIHGVTDNALCWTTLAWELEDDYNIYMLDARAHGLSDPFYESDDGDTLVKDVVGFVEKMGIEKPILMGHSMGGATVVRLGAEYPDLASAIVILDAGIGGPKVREDGTLPRPPESKAPEGMSIGMLGKPENLVAQNNYSYDDLMERARRSFPKWDEVDRQYWALSKIQYHGPYGEDAWHAMQGVMRTEGALEKISVPTIILKADASPEDREAHRKAASVMQNGEIVHIDDAGHNLHHDQLDRTVEVLTDFFAKLQL